MTVRESGHVDCVCMCAESAFLLNLLKLGCGEALGFRNIRRYTGIVSRSLNDACNMICLVAEVHKLMLCKNHSAVV